MLYVLLLQDATSSLHVQGSHQGDTYSRSGAEPAVIGTASNWHRPSDANYSPDRIGKLSNEAGLTTSNPDASSGNNRAGGFVQRDSGSSTGNARIGASNSSEFGRNSGQYSSNDSAGSAHGHQGQFSSAAHGQGYGGQAAGFTQGHGQQDHFSGFPQGHIDGSDEFVTRLPSTGIPPVFHPPSYVTSDVPSYSQTAGQSIYNNSTQGINAKQALEPLTEVQAGGASRDIDVVHAKQALDPLTHIAPREEQEEVGGVYAKDALQPLTEVPAQDSNKGFVESIKEYLPGHQQTGAVQVNTPLPVGTSSCNHTLVHAMFEGRESMSAL